MTALWFVPALAARSLWNRRFTALLTVLAVAISVTLFVGVEKLRQGARSGFERTISGTDLIVGARSSPINLLLYSVFRIGDATANISWSTYERIAARPEVAWTVPLSLGDSHRGFRVLGTTPAFFERYRYAGGRELGFASGGPFTAALDAVLGAEVAADLGYGLGDAIVVAHGVGAVSFAQHEDAPFRVVGILQPTGTPVDRSVHVGLAGIEAMHANWQTGARRAPSPVAAGRAPKPGSAHEAHEAHGRPAGAPLQAPDSNDAAADDHAAAQHAHGAEGPVPDSITAFLVGLKSRIAVLRLQRDINTYGEEALLAIIPGMALTQLWQVVAVVERALSTIAGFVIVVGLVGVLTSILTSVNERRREMAILRAVGARPLHIFLLLVSEAALLACIGAVLGLALLYALLAALAPVLESRYGIALGGIAPAAFDAAAVAGVTGLALLLGTIPAWRAYRNALADGLSIRI